jgi:(1->4)-alpha-D-glucan 1-alpha-D-glucosylmutase
VTEPPRSTYRVQLTPDFGFDAAAAIADYLAALGVSHFYASPYLQAAPGSTHGYDVVDHHRANEELGGAEGHARLCQALGEAGLGQVLDVVPNHMAIGVRQNEWWWDVLENGPSSVYASYFDVVWDPPEAKLRNTVLLPVLGDHYGRVLEAGEITLRRDGGQFIVSYYDTLAPVAPRSLDTLLLAANERVHVDELESVAAALGKLPPAWATDTESVRERHRDKEVLKDRLAQLCEDRPEVAEAIDAETAAVNADPDRLDALLERQNYRLAYWRTAGRELDYRRFFDINTLIGLRTEDEQVFEDTHSLILEWVGKGVLDGLRIDHPDGLRDPAGYLERLARGTGGGWVVVEKILEPGERLPGDWATAGTTGYDFLNCLGGLFVDPAGEAPLTALYEEFTGESTDYEAVVLDKKHNVLEDALAADLNRLTSLLVDVCERHRRYRDYTRHDLQEVLREVVARFPVYRTYVVPGRAPSEADVQYLTEAVESARDARPDLDADLFTFLRDVLLQGVPGGVEEELTARFQQLTGPVMAKGVEDTAFYVFNRLVSLNEVGGDPSRFGVSVEDFHAAMAEAQRDRPAAMLTTSTHDTKRSEDVRARIALLSEIPDQWAAAVRRWSARQPGPDPNTAYLFWQTLVGAWPWSPDRAVAYMEKATKEAKARTSWTNPDTEFDAAVADFVRAAFDDAELVRDVEAFVAPLVGPGRVNSLAQALVKLTAPGVPDVYQGQELWDLSLVDPDNRRPVDYHSRRRLLAELDGDGGAMSAEEILTRADEGLPKLWVTASALRLRQRRPDAFRVYEPLPAPERIVAFSRGDAVTIVPRLVLGRHADGSVDGSVDGTVVLPERAWRNVLTGEDVAGGEQQANVLLARFPVALLEAV